MPTFRLPRPRHLVVRHRRWLAAACAFLTVLLGLSALQPSALPVGTNAPTSGRGSPSLETSLGREGLVAAPVRLADADITRLLTVGTVVDVLAADGRGSATVVADGVSVLEIPDPTGDGMARTGFDGALVLLAVTDTEATQLAALAAVGPLSVVLRSG